MRIRRIAIPFLGLCTIAMFWPSHVEAQSKPSTAEKSAVSQAAAKGEVYTATHVSAEMVEGKLNPATSKPGDQVVVRLQEDLKVDNQVVLKKGSMITGIVRGAKRAESRSKSSAQSMIQVDWRAPAVAAGTLNFALASVAYTNPLYAHHAEGGQEDFGAAHPSRSDRAADGGGGLLGGGLVASAVTSSSTSGATSSIGSVTNVGGKVTGSALAVPASSQAASSLQSDFGVSNNSLFMVGHGQAISSGGTSSAIDVYSQMSNDSILTSSNRDFEIASGAQMQFLVDSKR